MELFFEILKGVGLFVLLFLFISYLFGLVLHDDLEELEKTNPKLRKHLKINMDFNKHTL